MKTPRCRQQSGYALILMVLGLMGVGGVVLAGFTQQARQDVEQQRFLHNKRVLQEAKQALLMYAYNYPEIAARGPGRLPCPDTDSSDTPNPATDCEDGLGNGLVGRFPWNAAGMQFYEPLDASGEKLWYAVSKEFANFNNGNSINSDSLGSITISDQSGSLVYDGAVGNGVAAVIIAPGPPIARDENNDGTYEYTQDRVADADDPRNYLDTYNAFDNSLFINDESDDDDDGFILGPIYEDDPNSSAVNTAVVNDQMILITTEELVEVAERAVFQAYRSALTRYQADIGIARFPWLDPYDSDDDLTTFDAVATPIANPNIGRLPSIFADYFVDTNPFDSQPIKPALRLSVTIDDEVHRMTIPAPALANTFFRVAGVDGGNLISPLNTGYSLTRYFWDGHLSQAPTLPADDIWVMCPFVTGTEEDCNQDASGNYIGGGSSGVWLRVRQVSMTFSGGTPIIFDFSDRTDPTAAGIEIWRNNADNPDPQNHVYIAAEYDDSTVYFSTFDYDQDNDFKDSFSIQNSGSLTYGAGAADTIKVGLPYYPVLPNWVLVNNWHDMMMVAYSSAMQPGGDGACSAGVDDCLTLRYPGAGAVTRERSGLLVLSGSEGDDDPDATVFIDDTNPSNPPYFLDELGDIFAGENADNPPDLIFDYQSAIVNDVVLPLE